MVREADAESQTGPIILRYKAADQSLHGLKIQQNSNIKNIRPKNLEQRMALDLLMDKSVTAVTLFGKPGSGKTLITMAAAIQQLEKNVYDKIYYAKPYQHTGGEDELGFLKGDFDEKTGPWHDSFVDNLEPIFGAGMVAGLRTRMGNKPNDILRNFGMEPLKLGYSRGRSIAKALIIIDEAQNLTHIQLKTLLTRIGEGSKIVLMGDLGQIDLRGISSENASPFYKVVNSDAFKNSALTGHTLLIEGLRSPTTDLFDQVFKEIEKP
jgi:PhoH-like ATPase